MTASRALALVGLAVLAGCLGGPAAPTDGTTATEPATDTASPLPDETVALPDGPKERPERPEELTRDTVAEFVRTYEYRYAYNSLWYSEHSEVHLDCEVDAVENISAGWEVTVSCTGYSNTGGDATGTATATELHADWFTQTYHYYVDEDSVVRVRADEA